MADTILTLINVKLSQLHVKRKLPASSIKFYMAGNELENVNKIKDLGITACSLI